MKLSYRIGAAVFAATTAIGLSGGAAVAAGPTNDVYTGAETIGALPFSTSLDTSKATTDGDDAEINATCGAPATDASVWYTFTGTGDEYLLADVSGSDYSAGVAVATGAPGSFSLLACGAGGTAWQAKVGETYSILVFDDQNDGGGNGGLMSLQLEPTAPPPTIELTVDPTGTFNAKTGSATLSGTVTCSENAALAFIEAQLTQRVGRMLIRGYGGTDVTCDGTSRPWSFEVVGDNGLFKGGKTASVSIGVACGEVFCSQYFAEQSVQLKGKK